jgi:anti-anti-sigma factor
MQTRRFLEVERHRKGIAVRLLHSRLDPVWGQLSMLAREFYRPRLHLDLGNMEYVTAATLGKLVSLNKEVRQMGGTLSLRNVPPLIYEVFEVTRVTELFDMRQEIVAASCSCRE